ncbi:choice-of-anchor L domain-containing protein [Aureivirga sp. CE67]|uniref:choice-of-anchor L domain-containing protein n=1 Tax=Aureivirga sp. CE67 TaxID=1788983 RepID=UPI0018CB90BB|nr:choice-of-anchor L domain-containing protein [Aureivirga sp. CE67]
MKKLLLSCSAFFIGATLFAQTIEVNEGPEASYTPEELIENVFANQSCIDVSWVSDYTNPNYEDDIPDKSYGYFVAQEGSEFPFSEGIMLTTGKAHNTGVLGSNNSNWEGNWEGDDNISEMIPNDAQNFNATIFEFNFIAPNELNQIHFNYLMASEEYRSDAYFPCYGYADSFALIVSGPGIEEANYYDHDSDPNTPEVLIDLGGKNIALIPGTNIPIAITNIYDNAICGQKNVEWYNTNGTSTNYDGETLPFEASIDVIPGEEYHIKMVVVDVQDSIFDTAVFLDGNSFILPDFYFDEIDDQDGQELVADEGFTLDDYSDLVNVNYYCADQLRLNNEEPVLTITQTPPAGTVITEDTVVTLAVTDNIVERTNRVNFNVEFKSFDTLNTEELNEDIFRMYPNPTSGIVYINGFNKINSIKAFDYNGAEVYNQIITNSIVDFSDLNSGIYFLEMEMKDGTTLKEKLIIQ